MKNCKRKSHDNKGNSLIELVCSVATMSVLVGTASPVYLKYVEKAREVADLANYSEIVMAIEIYAIDHIDIRDSQTLTFEKGNSTSLSTNGTNQTGWLYNACDDAGIDEVTMTSNAYGDMQLTVSVNNDYSLGFTFQSDTDKTAGARLATALGIGE